MAQRVLKIILPPSQRESALLLLEAEENTHYWPEENSDEVFVVSALTEAEHSEQIMDVFEQRYGGLEGFKLIVFPVEASVPRTDEKKEKRNDDAKETVAAPRPLPLRISREELYSDIVDSTRLSPTFILMTVLSTLVATIGLQQNNVAVIIGAMVIAPFLGPNVAVAFSTCLADRELGNNAVKTLFVGVAIAVVLSAIVGHFYTTGISAPEIAARTRVGLIDVVLALASGCAGVLAFTTGASSAVIGVMVAVALLPPLAVFGLLLGAGNFSAAAGALLMFSTNIICINLAGVATFLGQGVTPRAWWQADKAKKATRTALLLWAISLALLVMVIMLLRLGHVLS